MLPLYVTPSINRNVLNPQKPPAPQQTVTEQFFSVSSLVTNNNNNYANFPQNSYASSRIPPIHSFNIGTFPTFAGQNQSQESKVAPKPQNNNIINNNIFVVPQILIPPETEAEIGSQNPSFFRDPESGEYGMRCVCGKSHTDGLLLQCEHCEYWLHGMCVNIARLSPSDPYFCPFCLGQRIKCCCNCSQKDLMLTYSDPLIRCSKCHFFVHKECENLDFGVVPRPFICTNCRSHGIKGSERAVREKYQFPCVKFDDCYPNNKILIDMNRAEFLASLPDGAFKDEIEMDLNSSEIEFKVTLEKYYQKFAALIMDRAHEFWKVFVNSLCTLMNCERSKILDAIDHLTTRFLYRDNFERLENVEFAHSDAITEFLKQSNLTCFERQPDSIDLYIDHNGRICSPVAIDDGNYIADLPGFLMHADEVDADDGIPKSCILVTNSDIIVDMNGTTFENAEKIRRSFHFNTIVKLIRIKGEVHAALFATRTQGPLSDQEKNRNERRRGPAIPENGEIVLPFDGGIPFDVVKVEWKEKKSHNKSSIDSISSTSALNASSSGSSGSSSSATKKQKQKPHKQQRKKSQQEIEKEEKELLRESEIYRKRREKRFAKDSNLSLLSSFMTDAVPPMPFILLPDQNAVDKYKMLKMVKTHSRHT